MRSQSTMTGATLRQHHDFLKLWGGETVALFGSQITSLTIPLAGALILAAAPTQMGILSAVGFAPFLLLTLFAGAWIDRRRRRPTMIAANLGRGALLLTVPLAAWLGVLRIEWLYLVAFCGGGLQVLFELVYQSYIPTLVGHEHLVKANSKLQGSASVAQVAGPGLAGLLIQVLTAPFALLADALSFLTSALSVALIRSSEPAIAPPQQGHNIWREIGAGLGLHPALAICALGVASALLWVAFSPLPQLRRSPEPTAEEITRSDTNATEHWPSKVEPRGSRLRR